LHASPTRTLWVESHPEILPEEWLLFDLAKTNPSRADIDDAIALTGASDFSWTNAWNLATRLWVHGLVAKNVRDEPKLVARAPHELKPLLALSQFTARTRCAMYVEATTPAFVRLMELGIPFALMKGAAMLSRFPPGTRLLNDLDLLIRQDDYAQVAKTFQDCGFQRVLSKEVSSLGQDEAYQLRTDNEITFVKGSQQRPLSIDVHWSMQNIHLPFVVDTRSVLSRASRVAFGDITVPALSPEDTLINYGVQLFTDGLTVGFLRLADIHAVATNAVCWDILCENAIRAQSAGVTYLALMAARALGADVPDDVCRTLEAACRGCHFGAQIVVEPRWPLDRFRLAGSASHVLTPLFCASRRYGMQRIASLPRQAYTYNRHTGRTPLHSMGAAARTSVHAVISAMALLGLWIGRGPRTRLTTRRLRDVLWRRRDSR
jgi:hypothetical protein